MSSMAEGNTEWYRSWFDSPYYALLYSNRDDAEAASFIDAIMNHCMIPSGSEILDLACGRGRHSRYLHSKGFSVTGIDLSEESIKEASQYQTEGLQFVHGDMREIKIDRCFDVVLNLFTSFGYFENPDDNLKVLQGVERHLKSRGFFLMDYFNSEKLRHVEFQPTEIRKEEVVFRISKEIGKDKIVKTIEIDDHGKTSRFQEMVSLFCRDQLTEMIESAGLRIAQVYGDYHLGSFNNEKSDRIILISNKP